MSTDDQPRDSETNGTGGRLSRRRMMAAGAAGWATVSLAGCSSPGGSGSGGNTDDTPEQTTTTDVSVSKTTTTTTTGGDGDGDEATTTTTSTGGSGGDGGGGGDGKCGLSNVFASGMDVGFLVSVYDNYTGALLDDGDLATVLVSFPDADFEPVALSTEGAHTEHVREKWGGKLATPADAEPGSYTYEVSIQRAGDEEPRQVATDEFVLVDQ